MTHSPQTGARPRAAWLSSIAGGLVLWATFALAMRSLPGLFQADAWNLAVLVAIIPTAFALVMGARRLWSGARSPDPVIGMSLTALLIDGVVMTFLPEIYSTDPATARNMAGFLLFGVGATLVAAALLPLRTLAPERHADYQHHSGTRSSAG